MMGIRKAVRGIYREMQKNYWSFRIQERITNMMKLLSDEKSKIVFFWGGVMRYRRMQYLFFKELYFECDQYFCKDIIKLHNGEVFVDGGVYTGI